ncbi:DUF6279 family lipoprotein [Pseudidiomarina sp.]|uniref:DUF6279 family lipoprotein n=1 Tax=Pseudidiomarina sp. TaxID=2081707 RepID=UPI00299D4A45|nr:DUF6279 family lipoprotein [Pseudidiomarina sp.]MDX1706494.1 DUF6279 family lipoprotein [Pseudidiomarina sp.]
MKQLFTLILIVFVLTGCSNRLGYRFADTLVEWKLDDYVDLSGNLERDVSASIDELHRWHAQTQLPAYRDLLLKIRTDLTREDLTEQDLLLISTAIYGLWENIQLQVEPYAQVYLPRLSAAQRDQLVKTIQKDLNEDIEEIKEQGSYEDSREKRYKRMQDSFSEWLGTVTEAQLQYINQWLDQRDDMRMDWVSYRQRWLNNFAGAISEPSAADYPQRIYALIVQPEQLRSPELQARIEANRAASIKLVHQVYQSMTAEQRRHLLDTIDGYLEDLDSLIETFSI